MNVSDIEVDLEEIVDDVYEEIQDIIGDMTEEEKEEVLEYVKNDIDQTVWEMFQDGTIPTDLLGSNGKTCPDCGGDGEYQGLKRIEDCDKCNGTGLVSS